MRKKSGLEFELALYGRNIWLLHGSRYEKVLVGNLSLLQMAWPLFYDIESHNPVAFGSKPWAVLHLGIK